MTKKNDKQEGQETPKSLTELKAEAYDLIAQKEQLVNTANYIQELLNQKNAEIQAVMTQSGE